MIEKPSFSKAYIEITNVCNLSCSFCPGTKRTKRFMTADEFDIITEKLRGRAEHLYFHIMGEPLLHPLICDFAKVARAREFKLNITTNGTLLQVRGKELVGTGALHKVSISLHSFEANDKSDDLRTYLSNCLEFADYAAENDVYCVFRLWNLDGLSTGGNSLNDEIISVLSAHYKNEWEKTRSGYRLQSKIFLEWGEKFDWPGQAPDEAETLFCYALRNQIGILCDGTAVPCCLDSEGNMPLGNLITDDYDDIISSERAERIYSGFTSHKAREKACMTCGYARRFTV